MISADCYRCIHIRVCVLTPLCTEHEDREDEGMRSCRNCSNIDCESNGMHMQPCDGYRPTAYQMRLEENKRLEDTRNNAMAATGVEAYVCLSG